MNIDEKYNKLEKQITDNVNEFQEYLINSFKDENHNHGGDFYDCDCEIVFYVRFDRKTLDLSNWNWNDPQTETEPYTNSSSLVIVIELCVDYTQDKDDLQSALIHELDYLHDFLEDN